MTQTTNRFFDEAARLMNDAAGVAQGVRREFDTLFRTQAERILRDLDVVKREEFEAVKEMARLAREENEALKARIAALEAKLGDKPAKKGASSGPHPTDFRALARRFSPFWSLRSYNPARYAAPGTPGGLPRSWAAEKAAFSIGLDEDFNMATVLELKATVRPKGGKGAARAARRSGNVPGVILR